MAPSSFRSSAGRQTGSGSSSGPSTSRPLSILSTLSSHKREPADVISPSLTSPSSSSSSSPSASGKRRDSRGLQAAALSKNFEDELIGGGTRHLKSASVGSGQSHASRKPSQDLLDEGSPDVDDYDDGDDYDVGAVHTIGSYARDQEILVEEDEPPSPVVRHHSGHTRTAASTAAAFKQPTSTPQKPSSSLSTYSPLPADGSLPPSDPRSRTSSADTASSLTPKPAQLPTFPSASSSVYSTASAAPEAGMMPAPPVVVPPTPTSASTATASGSSSGGLAALSGRPSKVRQISAGSPSSYVAAGSGLEDEAGSRRRSLFRGGGTASSPDLATLVRKKKEARAAQVGYMSPTESAANDLAVEKAPPTPEKDIATSRHRESSDPTASRGGNWAGGRLDNLSDDARSGGRRPSAEEALGEEWVRGDLSPGATAEERLPGVRAIGLGFGSIEKEGFNKSMRNKAKNVFSKMFAPASPSRPQARSTISTGSLRLPSSTSSASLSPQAVSPSAPIHATMSRRASTATNSTTPKGPNATLPTLGPPITGSPSTSATIYERRRTDPAPDLPPVGTRSPRSPRSPAKNGSGRLSPGGGRRRSLSVGGMGAAGWENDVEGLFDGIADDLHGWTPPTSPTDWDTGRNRGEESGSRSEIDLPRRGTAATDRPFATSTAHARHMSDAEDAIAVERGYSQPISTTTTITAGRGTTKRVVVGKKTSNPPKPSSASQLLSLSPKQPPTPPPKERLSPSPSSSARTSSSRVAPSARSRTTTPSLTDRPAGVAPSPTPRSSSLGKGVPDRSTSPRPPSPVRGHYPVLPPTSTHTPQTSASIRSVGSSSRRVDEDEGPKEATPTAPSTSGRFQEQTIRLVPASPSMGTPTLPNKSSPTPIASPPLPPLPATSNPTFVHTAPDEDMAASTGLGIVTPTDRELEGDTDEEKGQDAARRILADDQTFKWVKENRVCEYLGGPSAIQHAAVTTYMTSYDFKDFKLEKAVRLLTSKLYFKAESQELDRVIGAFAVRFWACNPTGLYGSSDVVHQLVYALLLLNTDLHVVDQDRKMTRDGFVENTMGSIKTWAASQPPPPTVATDTSALDDGSGSIRGGGDAFADSSVVPASESSANSTIGKTRRNRSGSMASSLRDRIANHGSTPALVPSHVGSITSPSASSVMLHTPGGSAGDPRPPMSRFGSSSASLGSFTLSKGWINDMESLLKDMYTAVKAQRILQPIGETVSAPLDKPSSSLHSSPSSLSRGMSLRSHSSNTMTSKRNSMRGLGFLSDTLGSRSRLHSENSISGRNSPTPSHATSLGDVFLGPDSGSVYNNPSSGATPMGFAHNLSRTIIQEHEDESDSSDTSNSTAEEISDEILALEGPPWAKEGMLTRRLGLTDDGRKSKDKNWKSLFGVAQGGNLSTFTFGEGSSSGRGGTVGGGNWSNNAQSQHRINLIHSYTQALKPPYSRSHPHVFSVKECTGALTYFEVGTETIVEEWTITCNYWAARLSQLPLSGGVSNMDYGWGRPTYPGDDDEKVSVARQRTISSGGGGGGGGISTFVNEWNPPFQGTNQSTLGEQEQLQALTEYKKKLVAELEEFRPMDRYLVNTQKARDNYARKLAFLEFQMQKYSAYVDCLGSALAARYAKRGDARQLRDLKKADKSAARSQLASVTPSLRSVEVDEDDDGEGTE